MGDYSSFYLYRKYEVTPDGLIPTDDYSIDGNGTMPSVIKNECDPECGCPPPEPIYRWVVVSGEFMCSGTTKMTQEKKQISYDSGATWVDAIPSETRPALPVIEYESEDCGYVPPTPTQYRWTQSGTTCDNANKYQNNIKEQSLDEGLTWTVVIPEEYSASTLVQQDSYDCGYRTGTTSSSTYCNGDDLYVDVYYRTSRDSGTTWVTASTTPTLVEAGGCATPAIEYRWTQSGTTCIGYDKYQNNIKEQSTDGGTTWTVVIPEEYSASTLIESQSTDCGYVPPTPASSKFILTLSNSSVVTAECDATSAITSGEMSSQYSSTVVSAEIGDCVTEISYMAFQNCYSLTSVTIGNGVTSIGDDAFNCCSGLTSCTIPSGVTSIGNNAFVYCSSLTSIDIPDNVITIGYGVFHGCTSLTSIVIPNTVTSIGSGAFNSCYSLISVTIGSGITSIGTYTFYGCTSLTSIVIPNTVTSIGSFAFKYCTSLTSITVLAVTPPSLGSSVFDNTNNCPIYVPAASLTDYQTAWSTYASRIQAIT